MTSKELSLLIITIVMFIVYIPLWISLLQRIKETRRITEELKKRNAELEKENKRRYELMEPRVKEIYHQQGGEPL